MPLSVTQMVEMSRLLDEALSLDESEKPGWLERVSLKDPGLAKALRQSLLCDSDVGFDSIDLETLPKIGASPKDPCMSARDLKPGERVGPYRLVRPLGEGGMAEVWLAQRADRAFERDVALKLPLREPLRPDLVQRFAHERRILANLEHPNIARMYDAGVHADGRPYLVMEYVRGEPMIAWCDARRLGLPERIELFLQLLDAVQYAHAQRVIHRDLKPSNILVTPEGQVRLLDFGAARRLGDPDTGQAQLTLLYGKALTPDYSSPELLGAESGDVASDVYALGVVLYELLTGDRPYRTTAGASVQRLQQEVATVRIERPSAQLAPEAGQARGTTEQGLARVLCGDLDAIALKALSSVRAKRYRSASALAHDLRSYLNGEHIETRTNRPILRAGRFLARHRSALTATLALLAAVCLVLTQLTWLPNPATARVDDRSIAVLPFADMSEKKDQEYFADGVAEEIRDLLSNVPQLRVTARTSSLYFKSRRSTIEDTSRALGVQYVLEGSVRNSGNHVRVSAQLVRASNGYHVWSETYDRNLDDLFKVQDDIAKGIVKALKATLLPDAAPDFANAQAPAGVDRSAG